MKKFFLIAAAAALVLSSCSKNTVSEDTSDVNAIGFGTYSGRTTKADGSLVVNGTGTTNSFTDDTHFGVYGYYTYGATEDAAKWTTAASPAFMNNYDVHFKSNTYTYTPVKYWPKDETLNKISFFGYYPYNNAAITTKTVPVAATGLGSYVFTVPELPANHVDFMLSDFVKDQSYSHTNTTTNGLVQLDFHHMLTRVGVAINTNADKNTTVKITSIIFKGGYIKTGTLAQNATATNSVWTLGTDTQSEYRLPVNDTKATLTSREKVTDPNPAYVDVCATDANSFRGDLLLIPQALSTTAKTNYIEVKYDYTTDGVTVHDTATADLKDQVWGMNKYTLYQLTIDLASREIKFTAIVENWDSVTNNTIPLQ
jgi:hypothetical protein